MEGSLARKLTALLLLTVAFNGCAAFHPVKGVPVKYIPADWHAQSRENTATIDLSLLGQVPPSQHIVDKGDTLGIYIEGVLGVAGQAPPISAVVGANEAPRIGYPLEVRDDGTISLPLIGAVDVTGMTVRQVEEHIRRIYTVDRKILVPGQDRIIVSLQKPREIRVLVMRQETQNALDSLQPGSVNLGVSKRGTGQIVRLPAYKNDVLHALAQTGGLPGLDAENTIYIIRRAENQVQTKPSPLFNPSQKPAAQINNIQHSITIPEPASSAIQQMSYEVSVPSRLASTGNEIELASYRSALPTSNYRSGPAPSDYRSMRPAPTQQVGSPSPFQGYRSAPSGFGASPSGNYRSTTPMTWPAAPVAPMETRSIANTKPAPTAKTTAKKPTPKVQTTQKKDSRWNFSFTKSTKSKATTSKTPEPKPTPKPTPKPAPEQQVAAQKTIIVPAPAPKPNATPFSTGSYRSSVNALAQTTPEKTVSSPKTVAKTTSFANAFSMEDLAAHPDLVHSYIGEPTVRNHSIVKIPVRLKPGQMPHISPDDVILQDGDIVFIESRETEIFYTGGLLGGGQYTLPRDYDLDVLGAISLAQSGQNQGNQVTRATGGVSAINGDVTISASQVIILRKLPTCEHVRIKVDLYKAIKDPAENIQIMPGDMVMLRYKPLEAVCAAIERHLLEGALFGVAAAQLNTNN